MVIVVVGKAHLGHLSSAENSVGDLIGPLRRWNGEHCGFGTVRTRTAAQSWTGGDLCLISGGSRGGRYEERKGSSAGRAGRCGSELRQSG